MDLDNIVVEVFIMRDYNEAREKYLNLNPDRRLKDEEEDRQLIKEAERNIKDYIITFRRLPSKKVEFRSAKLPYDDYHVINCSLIPENNEVHCVIDF